MSTVGMNINVRDVQFLPTEVNPLSNRHIQPPFTTKRKLSGEFSTLDHYKQHISFFSETQSYRDAQQYIASSGRRCAVGHIFDGVLSARGKRS